MNLHSKSLTQASDKLKEYGATVQIDNFSIEIDLDLIKSDFPIISRLLYGILDKLENRYFITIKSIPYCLMPDAAHHIIYKRIPRAKYDKNNICKQCRYYADCPGWRNSDKLTTRPPSVANLPREVIFEVTQKCNLNCPSCFSSRNIKEASLSKVKSLIDECSKLGIGTVRFTGGEPLLYNHIEEVLCYAKSKNHYVMLNTNATLLNRKTERILKNYVDNILISLQGFSSASEKQLTNSSITFKKKIQNIVKLNSQIPTVRLGTVISRTLLRNFDKYSLLIKKLGINHWELYRPMMETKSNEFRIERNDFIQLMKRIKVLKLRGLDVKIANPLPFCITSDLDLSQYVLLGAEADDGHCRIVHDVRGFFKPSYFIARNLGQTITTAWQNPFLEKIRSLEYLPEKCHNCYYLKWCKGGSRSWARKTRGNYLSTDPLMSNNDISDYLQSLDKHKR